MKFPSWLKTKRQRRVGNTVEVTLEAQVAELHRRFAELGRAMGPASVAMAGFGSAAIKAAAEMDRAWTKVQADLGRAVSEDMVTFVRREMARQEVRQAGLEARYYVRGAMDPTYATPEARDAYVRALCTFMGNGPVMAAAFLRGWVEHHPEPECACWMTKPSTWLSGIDCGYGSGYEPGSQWEWNPDCPVHRPDPTPVQVDDAVPVSVPVCDGRCVEGREVLEGAPGGSMYAVDPFCSLHGDGPPELEECHADGAGPCVAACCPIAGLGPWRGHLRPCPPVHPVSSGVR